MNLSKIDFYNKKIFIYGLARTGVAALNFLKDKKNQIYCWDDKIKIRNKISSKYLLKSLKSINTKKFDLIVISPGINKYDCPIKSYLQKNKNKIVTDLDIFYIFNKKSKFISITGTNGKSTTCKLIYDIFRAAGIKTELGGNIGRPILSLNKLNKKKVFILELSSYQLDYTKYFRPNYSIITNISPDHLERHKNMQNYIKAKFKIFKFQEKKDFLYYNKNNKFLNKIKKKIKSNIKLIQLENFNKIKKKITNNYFLSPNNIENLLFALEVSKNFKIQNKKIFKAVNSFKGLPHRQEEIYMKNKIRCINDSKATSFDASSKALQNYKNIFWLLGGINKKNDSINLQSLKKNIIKAYIIGKNTNFFINNFKNKIRYMKCKNLTNTFLKLKEDIKIFRNQNRYMDLTILFSPSAASFDIYKNFEERGNHFKKLFMKNKNKIVNV